jgi:hypothetical protein
MKQLIIITFLLFCFEKSYAQIYDTTRYNITPGLSRIQHVCEGEEVYISYDSWSTGIGIGTTDNFYKWLNPNACFTYEAYDDGSFENNS